MSEPIRLNLGAADRSFPGYVSVDIIDPESPVMGLIFQHVDLSVCPWPWLDSTITEIIAYDIVEHLPDRVLTMNEIHRVLIDGGIVRIEVPDAAHGPGFWQDPTHKSGWTRNSFQYFTDRSYAVQRLARAYGITARFEIVELTRFGIRS